MIAFRNFDERLYYIAIQKLIRMHRNVHLTTVVNIKAL